MKLLMIYTNSFSYKTAVKTLDIPEINENKKIDLNFDAQDALKAGYQTAMGV